MSLIEAEKYIYYVTRNSTFAGLEPFNTSKERFGMGTHNIY